MDIKQYDNKFFQWMQEEFCKEDLFYMVNYGCASGIKKISFFSETNAVFKKFENEILEIIQNFDEHFPIQITKYTRLNAYINDLVWFACECVALEILESLEIE